AGPTLAAPPADPARPFDHIAFTLAFNMSEQPAASIDCGRTHAGLPIGLQIIGRRHDDLTVPPVARARGGVAAGAAPPSGLDRFARSAHGERARALADDVVLRHADRRPRHRDPRRPAL